VTRGQAESAGTMENASRTTAGGLAVSMVERLDRDRPAST
jgi:hypothetical protein